LFLFGSFSLSLALKCEIFEILFRRFPLERLLQAGVVLVVVAIIHKPGGKCFLFSVSIAMMMMKMKNKSCSDGTFVYLVIDFDFGFCRNY
jgi:hypothetical protein